MSSLNSSNESNNLDHNLESFCFKLRGLPETEGSSQIYYFKDPLYRTQWTEWPSISKGLLEHTVAIMCSSHFVHEITFTLPFFFFFFGYIISISTWDLKPLSRHQQTQTKPNKTFSFSGVLSMALEGSPYVDPSKLTKTRQTQPFKVTGTRIKTPFWIP